MIVIHVIFIERKYINIPWNSSNQATWFDQIKKTILTTHSLSNYMGLLSPFEELDNAEMIRLRAKTSTYDQISFVNSFSTSSFLKTTLLSK